MIGQTKTKVYFTDAETTQLIACADPSKAKFWSKFFNSKHPERGFELNSDMIGHLQNMIITVQSSDILEDSELEALKSKIEQLSLMQAF